MVKFKAFNELVTRSDHMDIILLCREGLFESVINNLAFAMAFRKAGKSVGVLFTGNALYCLCNGVMRWSNPLAGMQIRKTITNQAKKMDLPITSPEDQREIDIKPLLKEAKELGVMLYCCPLWSNLLDLSDKFPEELNQIGLERIWEEMARAEKVIGGL